MRHHQNGLAAGDQRLEQAEYRIRCLGVQIASRLIGNHDRRIVGQCPGDGRPLLVPPGDRRRKLVGVSGNSHLVQQMVRPFIALIRGIHLAQIHRQHDILDDGECRQELKKLKDDSQIAASPHRHLPLIELANVGASDNRLALRRVIDTGEHIDER